MFIKIPVKPRFMFTGLALAVVFVLNCKVSYADPEQREIIIQRELDCIAKAHENNIAYTWTDLCYTHPADSTETFDQNDHPFAFNFGLLSGYRHDDLKFNIAGNVLGSNPNILSELTWKDIQSFQIQAKGQVVYNKSFVLEGSVGYSFVFSGKNQDSDYLGDDRTLEFSRSNNSADHGYMDDLSGGLGYRFNLDELIGDSPVKELNVTPLVGFARNAQNLRMTNGNQTLDPYNLVGLGPFPGLHSKYNSQWYGPWISTELHAKVRRFTASLRVEYHMMEYHAQANWNLRDDLMHPKSFEHTADGSGYTYHAGLDYNWTENWQINLGVDFYYYRTEHGIDKTYVSDGSVAETQLNVVDWNSYSVNAGLKYSWF